MDTDKGQPDWILGYVRHGGAADVNAAAGEERTHFQDQPSDPRGDQPLPDGPGLREEIGRLGHQLAAAQETHRRIAAVVRQRYAGAEPDQVAVDLGVSRAYALALLGSARLRMTITHNETTIEELGGF